MPNTTRGYPYPADGDPADVPADMQAALEAVDADVTGVEATADQAVADLATTDSLVATIDTQVTGLLSQNLNSRLLTLEGLVSSQQGQVSFDPPSLVPGGAHVESVTFPQAFATPPFVLLEQAALPSGSQYLNLVPYNRTENGFDIYVYNLYNADQNFGSISVVWIAFGAFA